MRVCTETKQWIEEQVEQPVDRWVEKTEKQCKDYPWYDPRGWVCWLVTIVVKVVEIVIVTVGKWVTHVVCVVINAILNAASFLVGLVLSIPIVGPLIRAWIRAIAEFVSQVLGIFDMAARLVGIRIRKNVRICIIILNEDRLPVVDPQALQPAIAWAKATFYDQAKVNLVVTDTKVVNSPSPADNLDVNANAGAAWDELWFPGSYFETAANGYCFESAFSRLVALGSPIIVFVVRSVAGQATGCSLSTLTDYVTVERATFSGPTADPTVLAHELGHACSLLHIDGQENLMFANSSAGAGLRGSHLPPGQTSVLRGSRHVTVF